MSLPHPPPPHPLHIGYIFPSQPSVVQPIHQGLIPAHFLLSLLFKHLRMFAHFQFSLFLWYDNNVKQRYCYGCCAEIGSFMPQTVSFPEKTIVVKKIWSIWIITFKVRTFPWQSPRLSKYQFIFNLTIKYWILVYLGITFWSSLISFCITIPKVTSLFFLFVGAEVQAHTANWVPLRFVWWPDLSIEDKFVLNSAHFCATL